MASRSWRTQALVISLSTFGEGHREATLLTEDSGLLRAALYGGAKSKLRALVAPYQTGTVWLYADPVKKSAKITDFDVTAFREPIRDNLVRAWCAALCAELVTKTQGVADWRLVNAFLDGITRSGEDECRRGLLRYLWRTLTLAGLAPAVTECGRCGKKTLNEVVWYSPAEDATVCDSCLNQGATPTRDGRGFRLTPEATAYLAAIDSQSPTTVRAIPLGAEGYATLRHFLFFLVSRMIDGKLKTLETGEGIL
jgi:DNA repair protein RecO (recombination protein O)